MLGWPYSGKAYGYRYVRVDRGTFTELSELDSFLDGGSIEENALTQIKATGGVPFMSVPDIGNDLLRVYADIASDGGQVSHPLGTFVVSTPSASLVGGISKGKADLYSVLQIPLEQAMAQPLTLMPGTALVAKAAALLQGLGLNVVADQSGAVTSGVRNYPSGTSYLEAVNDMLEAAGFSSAAVDAYGSVLLTRYADPASLSPAVVLRDGHDCTFAPEVRYEFDAFNVPNQVIARMSNDEVTMTAVATNSDPGNRYSTVSRGRIVTHVEEVSDIGSQPELQALAQRVLSDKTSAVESMEVRHLYVPFAIGSAVLLDYSEAGASFLGTSVKRTVRLSPGMPCTTRLRRFVRG